VHWQYTKLAKVSVKLKMQGKHAAKPAITSEDNIITSQTSYPTECN
jgi:hypothetical protein